MCNSEAGLSMGFSNLSSSQMLIFTPTQKIKQFRGMYRFIVQQLLSFQWTLQNLHYGVRGQRKCCAPFSGGQVIRIL